MNEFKIKFRGVRGSYPIADKNYLEYGGNTSCVEVNVNGHLIILDAGTGLINLGNDLMEKYIASNINPYEREPIKATILISHIHQDHIQGFTFFRPLHIPSSILNVYGNVNYNESLSDELAELLFGKSFPLDLGDIAGNLNIHDLNENEGIILRHGYPPIVKRIESPEDTKIEEDDDVLITCYKSYAHPQEGVFIYKITYRGKVLVYATDKESYLGGDKKLANFARNCDVLILDDADIEHGILRARYSPDSVLGHVIEAVHGLELAAIGVVAVGAEAVFRFVAAERVGGRAVCPFLRLHEQRLVHLPDALHIGRLRPYEVRAQVDDAVLPAV